MKEITIFKITFSKGEDGKMEKKYEGVITPKDYQDIETGLASVIEYLMFSRKDPQCLANCSFEDETEFVLIFKKDALNQYRVETLSAMLQLDDLENILTGLMTMQIKLHLDKMSVNKIKFSLKEDSSSGPINYCTDDQLV